MNRLSTLSYTCLLSFLFVGIFPENISAGPRSFKGKKSSSPSKRTSRSNTTPTRRTETRPTTSTRPAPSGQTRMGKGNRSSVSTAQKESLADLKAKLQSGETKTKFAENSEELQSKFTEFQSNLKDNFDGDTQAMQAAAGDLKESMTTMMDGATKPDPAAVEAVPQDLQAVFSSGSLTPQQMKQLSEDVSALLTSSNITPEEAMAVANDVQALCEAAGVSKEDAQELAQGLVGLAQSSSATVPTSDSAGAKSSSKASDQSLQKRIQSQKVQRR